MHSHQYLFAQRDLTDTLREVKQRIPGRVNDIPQDQFMAPTDQQIIDHFTDELSWEPLRLHEEQAEMDQCEVEVDVAGDFGRDTERETGPVWYPGTRVQVRYPFTGDPGLWKLKPAPSRIMLPTGEVEKPQGDRPGHLVITIELPHDVPKEQFKQRLEENLENVRFHLNSQRAQLEAFNNELPHIVQGAITARRNRLKQHEGLSRILNIPLKKRDDAPPIEPIKLTKKIVKPLPPPPKAGFKPEPGIEEKWYQFILNVIRHEGHTFETTPKTFKKLDEEDIRNIILAHLNGHIEGGATGETFRKKGKTDIRIEDQDRVAFVAECKLWDGPKNIENALAQLLGYLTWRDCKAALVIFNKNAKGFTALLSKVPAALHSHSHMVNDLGQQGDGEWRFVFRSEEDEQRLITVHVFLFNLFVD